MKVKMNNCATSTNTRNECLMKNEINNEYNYVGCEHSKTLYIIKCGNKDCRNWFHHLCQNEYDDSKYENQFDQLHGLKKRYKIGVDEIMKQFDNSFHSINSDVHVLLQNDANENQVNNAIVIYDLTMNSKLSYYLSNRVKVPSLNGEKNQHTTLLLCMEDSMC